MSQIHSGKTVVITGATSGIGLATAKRFVDEGAYVFITGRRQAELDQAVKAIGRNVTGVQGDIANLADLDRLYAAVKTLRGSIDVLYANAGLGEFRTLAEVDEAHFDHTFDVNVKGTLFTVQKALPLLKDGASVILASSITAFKGQAAFGVYAASKAAIRSFARSWATDLKDRRIRVNAISPGFIPTEGYDALGINSDMLAQLAPSVPLGRVGVPDEIATAVSFLASEASSYINGTDMVIDGGVTQV
jgi:NAD(P)-dependent dehydrogenase (short-subunit alcohol dehydrogenase family)